MDLAITAYLLLVCGAVSFRMCRRYSLRHPGTSQLMIVLLLFDRELAMLGQCKQPTLGHYHPSRKRAFSHHASVILLVAMAGLFAGLKQKSVCRKRLMAWAVSLTAVWTIGAVAFRPVLQPIQLSDRSTWKDGVCLQSHEASCAPAAAATLLRMHCLQADERTLANRCLTSQGGTLTLAAFRGVSESGRHGGLSARAVVCEPQSYSAEDLQKQLPMLALVLFEEHSQRSEVSKLRALANQVRTIFSGPYASGSGQHAVVVLEQLEDGDWLVADPAIGRVRWSDDYFRDIWIGEGIYLVAK